jgi:hypothetical protein
MKRSINRRLPVFFLILFTLSSLAFFQKDSPPSTNAPKRTITDEIYARDSAQLLYYWDLYWRYENNDLHDSAIYACNKIIELGKEILPFRYDSVLFERYGKAFGGIGYSMMNLGDNDNALKYAIQSYDTLRSKFGENHIRITEVLVVIAGHATKIEETMTWL